MLEIEEARQRLISEYPDRMVSEEAIDAGETFIFYAPSFHEGVWSPFFSVNKTTGEIKDQPVFAEGPG